MVFDGHSWYTVGQPSHDPQVTTVSLNRIASVELSEIGYCIPQSFDLDAYCSGAWQRVRSDSRSHRVVVRFSPLIASVVANVRWHPSQKYDIADDGSLIFSAEIAGLGEVLWWVLGLAIMLRFGSRRDCGNW